MPRGYRSIILAAFAGLVLGAADPHRTGYSADHRETAKQIREAGERISASIAQKVVAPKEDGGCKEGKENRQSDLCAQWKAADAAKNAADYSLMTLILSAIGTGLLVWTLFETRQAAMREQRAYVRAVPTKGGVVFAGERVSVPINLENYGATPAHDVSVYSSVVVRHPDWDWSKETKTDYPEYGPTPSITLHPGPPFFTKAEMPEMLPPDVHNAIMGGTAVVYIRGKISYRDVFKKRRETRFQFEYHGSDGQPGELGRVRMANCGNTST